MTPVLTLEPRWYYNLNQRYAQSKNIKNNNGNFFGVYFTKSIGYPYNESEAAADSHLRFGITF